VGVGESWQPRREWIRPVRRLFASSDFAHNPGESVALREIVNPVASAVKPRRPLRTCRSNTKGNRDEGFHSDAERGRRRVTEGHHKTMPHQQLSKPDRRRTARVDQEIESHQMGASSLQSNPNDDSSRLRCAHPTPRTGWRNVVIAHTSFL
jgi:hypothetical protein